MSALSSLLPLIILFAVLGGGGYIGYQIYLWSNELADRGQKHMEKKNMNFTKDGGLRVGVKQMGVEEYADRTQRVLVNTWNEASFGPGGNSSTSRPASSRTASGSSRPATGRDSNAGLQAPELRGSAKRGSSPLPGGWS